MKYPQQQFDELKSALLVLKNLYKIDKETAIIHSNRLHFKIYQQKNFEYDNLNVIKDENGKRLFEINETYKLYPDGCNDKHIETAMKNAINEVFI
jgi:hypothetical protein